MFLISAITHVFTHCAEITEQAPYQPIIFSQLEGKIWAEKCMELYPEVKMLANSDVHKTEEGQATLAGPYSQQIFGEKYIEFDRTLMTLHCMKLILDGSRQAYLDFISAQKENPLSWESFQQLHHQGQTLLGQGWRHLDLSDQEIAQVLETALILGDIGKSERARDLFRPYGIGAPDHDDFYGEAMGVLKDHPHLLPSFLRLPDAGKDLLIKIANQAHYGHITHLEGGPSMFKKLKENRLDSFFIDFDLFVHTCDVAGALGHVNNQSSVVYTEPTHNAMQEMANSVKLLSNPKNSIQDAYDYYLAKRASWLGLNPENRTDRVLTRVGAMLRLFTQEEGKILKQAMDQLPPDDLQRIITQFDVSAQEEINERTPTYMPAVLVNLSNNPQLGDTKEQRLTQAILIGLPFLSKALEKHRQLLASGQADPNIPLNFNEAAGQAKGLCPLTPPKGEGLRPSTLPKG